MATKKPPVTDLAIANSVVEMPRGPDEKNAPTPGSTLMGLIEFVHDELEQRACGRVFSLAHIVDNAPHATLLSRSVPMTLPIDEAQAEAIKVAERFYAEAMGNILNHKLPQTYRFVVYGRDKIPCGTKDFTLQPPMSSMVGIGGLTESADERGVLHQHMRFSEVSVLASYASLEKMNIMLRDECKRKDARITDLEARQDAVAKQREDASAEAWRIEKERRQEGVKEKQVEQVTMAAIAVGKVAADKWGVPIPNELVAIFAGGAGGGDATKQYTLIIAKLTALFQSMQPDQILTITNCMQPLQKVAFAELMGMMPQAPAQAA